MTLHTEQSQPTAVKMVSFREKVMSESRRYITDNKIIRNEFKNVPNKLCQRTLDRDAHYRIIMDEFRQYLLDTADKSYISLKVDGNINKFGYIHRWHSSYQKRFIGRLFELQDWAVHKHNLSGMGVTFVTLTMSHKGYFLIEDQIMDIRKNFQILLRGIRHLVPKIQYLSQLDYHESGYAHFHILFFHEFTDLEREKIVNRWVKSLKCGDLAHGVDFKTSFTGTPDHFVAYIMRHAKSVMFQQENKPGWLLFSAVVWSMFHNKEEGVYDYPAVRLFSGSKHVTRAMRLDCLGESETLLAVELTGDDSKILYTNTQNNPYGDHDDRVLFDLLQEDNLDKLDIALKKFMALEF